MAWDPMVKLWPGVQGKHKGRQRPWEEGLTTGRSPASAEGRARAKEEFSSGEFTRT